MTKPIGRCRRHEGRKQYRAILRIWSTQTGVYGRGREKERERERGREAQQRTLTEIGNRNESENNDTLRHPSDSNSTCPMNSLLFCTVKRTNQREWQGEAEGNRKWVPRERQKNDRSVERKGGIVMEVNDIAC